MCESHIAKQSKSGANIGAAFEGAAAAVEDEIRRSREGSGPLLDVRQALFGGGAAVKRRAGDVASCEERAKTDIHDCGASIGACRGKFADEVRRLHELRRRQSLRNGRLTRLARYVS